ncbi:MAG: beta-ketoacyl-[acyl-carrier-protein] synthase family protein [Halanaerobiales bacterium]|nr:beta-ketoacyl-[acyl-carrier-protein] synthase family protein [Halanaerobiales bacterium]
MKERVVITGIGIVSALGLNKEAFLKGLKEGHTGIQEITLFDTEELFPTGGQVQNLQEDEGNKDRASIMLEMALKEALAESRLTAESGIRIGVVIGSAQGGLRSGEKIQYLSMTEEKIDDDLWREYPLNRLLHYVKSEISITGPALVISNACVSSTMALGVAIDAINDDLCDVMIVGGVDTMSRFVAAGFNSLKAVTNNLCRPFDREREGMMPGEGAGVLIVEREDLAKKRNKGYCIELAGYGSAADAVHMTAPDREGRGAMLAVKMALREASLEPGEIDYIIPHGTGTVYNDKMELVALEKVFGPNIADKPMSSIKSTTGHAMGASGIISTIAGVLAIENSFLPSNLNFTTPDVDFPNVNIVKAPGQTYKIDNVLVMTSAFGGSNAVAIIKRIKESRGDQL